MKRVGVIARKESVRERDCKRESVRKIVRM